eukprot:SAG31_NODE_2780_length_5098_cov_2.124000_4_plen_94_part_00
MSRIPYRAVPVVAFVHVVGLPQHGSVRARFVEPDSCKNRETDDGTVRCVSSQLAVIADLHCRTDIKRETRDGSKATTTTAIQARATRASPTKW